MLLFFKACLVLVYVFTAIAIIYNVLRWIEGKYEED
jgi:hypothetical protein